MSKLVFPLPGKVKKDPPAYNKDMAAKIHKRDRFSSMAGGILSITVMAVTIYIFLAVERPVLSLSLMPDGPGPANAGMLVIVPEPAHPQIQNRVEPGLVFGTEEASPPARIITATAGTRITPHLGQSIAAGAPQDTIIPQSSEASLNQSEPPRNEKLDAAEDERSDEAEHEHGNHERGADSTKGQKAKSRN